MEFGSLVGRLGGEHTGFGFVEISDIFAKQYVTINGTELLDRVQLNNRQVSDLQSLPMYIISAGKPFVRGIFWHVWY